MEVRGRSVRGATDTASPQVVKWPEAPWLPATILNVSWHQLKRASDALPSEHTSEGRAFCWMPGLAGATSTLYLRTQKRPLVGALWHSVSGSPA